MMKIFGGAGDKKDKKKTFGFGDLSGLALPFKKVDKSELNRAKIAEKFSSLGNSPVLLLKETDAILLKANRMLLKLKQRIELTELCSSYIFPVVLLLLKKYQKEESSLPESHQRKNALVASIEAVQQLSTSYKLLFRETYLAEKDKNRVYQFAAISLELIRLEQRLCALRYQKMSKVAWLHCNQIFFSLAERDALDQNHVLVAPLDTQNNTAAPTKASVQVYSVRKLFLSIQFFGLLDISTWPIRMFSIPDSLLEMLNGSGLKVIDDDGGKLKNGFLLTYYNNSMPAVFKRSDNFSAPMKQLDYTSLYELLTKDYKEIAKQQFIDEHNESKLCPVVMEINKVDRAPAIELIMMGLVSRERKQKRHTSLDDLGLSVYFGYNEVNRLLRDSIEPNQERVKDSRQFIDMMAKSTSIFGGDENDQVRSGWTISNFSTGGVLITTEDTDFNNAIQIDMLVAFTMSEKDPKPIVGLVRRLNRPNERQVEIAIKRLSNHAESAAVQDQNELYSSEAKSVILTKNKRGKWNLIVKTSMPYVKGQPLKLIRSNGTRIPIRLGKTVHTKKDFKVFEVSSPGLK